MEEEQKQATEEPEPAPAVANLLRTPALPSGSSRATRWQEEHGVVLLLPR